MAETKRDVEITLRARDAYSAEFNKLKGQIAATKQMSPDGGFGASATETLAKTLTLVGKVQAAMVTVNVLTNTFKGEHEAALQAIRQMPFGLGMVAQVWEKLIGMAIGMPEVLERLAKAQEDLREQEAFGAALDRTRLGLEAINDALEQQLRLERASELDRPFIQMENALDSTLKKIERIRDAAPAVGGAIGMAIARATAQAQDLADEQTRSIIRRRREEREKEARKAADELRSVESELAQAQARARGDALGAEIEAIRERFRVRIEAAREANKIEIAERLEALRDIALAEAKRMARRGLEQARPSGVEGVEARFLQRAPLRAMTEVNDREARRIAELKAVIRNGFASVDEAVMFLRRIESKNVLIRVEDN